MEDTKICSLGKMRKLTNTAGAASIKAAAFPPTLRKASVTLGSNKARIKIPAVSAFDKSAVTQIPLLGTSNFTFAFVVIISEKCECTWAIGVLLESVG